MRTSTLSLLTAAIALSFLAGCTVKDVDAPAFSGPSSLARSILMTVDRDTLVQNGEDEATITLRAQVPPGESENIRLRAQVFVGGVAQDFGTLSNKTPITPTTIRYRAPASSLLPAGQVPQTVTIAVTPFDQGDFRSEVSRTVDIRLVPQGVILPTNPALIPAFTFTPTLPLVMATVSLNASTTTNGGVACNAACTYSWNFGDGTTATGQTVTHEFRTAGNTQVALTVTDSRGAQAQSVQTITIVPGTLPSAVFTMSPNPVGINQEVFFTAEQSTVVPPRRIVNFGWTFGDGRTVTGMTVSRSFSQVGVYPVILSVTDDAGAVGRATQNLTVSAAGAGITPVLTFSPTSPSTATTVFFNASGTTSTSPIVEYRFNYGDGTEDVGTSSTQSHRFAVAGAYVVRVTVRDSLGRTATVTVTVTVT